MKTKWQKINTDSGEKTWLTPKHIIDALGHFDTDPCCPPNMPWRTADRMLTKEDDGTTAPWVGRVWCNPPYGRDAIPFLKRMSRYEGGVLCSCSQERTPMRGNRSYFRSHIRSCSSKEDCAFAVLMEPKEKQQRLRQHSSLIHNPTMTR